MSDGLIQDLGFAGKMGQKDPKGTDDPMAFSK